MEKMKELYEKVSRDENLQAKFYGIIELTQTSGPEETLKKLLAFAKESGYDVEPAEMQEFFMSMAETDKELSEEELEMVAGGKGKKKWAFIAAITLPVVSAATTPSGAGAVACAVGSGAATYYAQS